MGRTFYLCTISVLYLLLQQQTFVESHVKLNVPRVRLPYFDNLSVNFTLQVDTPGCYRWSVSRQDIISISTDGISPNDEGDSLTEFNGAHCSDKAIISTVPRVSPCCPASAIVFAEDVVTKETVRCDVIIDKITSIHIRTTTKELHLEEAPSKFHIQAYGSKDNEFSTLDGIPFIWAVESYKETSTMIDPQSIMRFMPFSESPYKASPGVAVLEAKRQQGDTVLVEGIKTGSAVVVARINDALYRSIDSRVRIVVVANLVLEPNEAFVVPGTVIPLRLIQIKHGQRVEISLPSNVYEFDVSNTSVVSYASSSSQIQALTFGETEIVVKDKNWVEGLEDEQPDSLTSRIYVREPKFLSIHVLPHRNWALVINQPYEIQVEIYDSENQKITIGDNVFVETTFDPAYFRVDYSSNNGTYHYGVPIKKGPSFVKAILKTITGANGETVEVSGQPRVKVEMEIFQSITINPKETVLPWDPNVQPKYDLRWNPSGGSGSFVWSSTNSSVVTVSQSGTGKTHWFGSVNVTAAASANYKIKGHARVHVLPPVAMEITPHIVEAEINTAIQVPLAFYTIRPNDPNKTRVPYSSCSKLPFQVTVLDPNFEYDAATHYPNLKPACVVLPIFGRTLGSSVVKVKYSAGPDLTFEDSVTVSTFKTLDVLEPVSKRTVLAVGASRQIAFMGGPRPLLEKHAGFQRTLGLTNDTVALRREIILEEGSKDDLYVYEVTCKEIGTTDAVFTIGNTKQSTTENSVVRVAVVQVICAEPAMMYYKVETPLKSKCPNDASATQVVRVAVPNYEPTQISVIVKDSLGNVFDNISSLQLEWKSDPDLVDFSHSKFALTEQIRHDLGYIVPGKSYQKIIPRDQSGNIKLTAEVKGYRSEIMNAFSLRTRKLSPQNEEESELIHEMNLQLVFDVNLNPTTVNVFNHPSAKAVVKIQDGSGHFEVDTGSSSVVGVTYHEINKTLEIEPLAQGSVKIKVVDLCISSRKDAEVLVDVNGVGYIKVEVDNEIQVGDNVLMNVSIYDHANNILSPAMLQLVKLQLDAPKPEVLQIQQFGSITEESRISYLVKGKSVGETTVTFFADGHEEVMGLGSIKSVPRTISVFPPLKLSPSKLIMLVGSVYQVTSFGGPPTNSQVSFSTDSESVIKVSGNGLLTGKAIGKTIVKGVAADISRTKKYSSHQMEVEVVNLKSIQIKSPLRQILSTEKMPLRIIGISEDGAEIDTAQLLGGASPIMKFKWTQSNWEAGELVHPFQVHGYEPNFGDQAQLQFHAKRPGRTSVMVVATYMDKKFTAEVQISVVDKLGLLHYTQDDQSILMAPNSEISLKTNKDSEALVEYKLQCFKDTRLFDKEKSVISVDTNGIVHSNDLIGQAIVLITASENFGLVQSRTVIIEVKRISYVMSTPSLQVNLKDRPRFLPRGLPILLTTTYHDNTGRPFDTVPNAIKYRPSRTDVIQVDAEAGNHTFTLATLTENRVALKIHDDSNSEIQDYLILSVGESIDPPLLDLSTLTVGQVVCFSCVLQAASGASLYSQGRWSTSSPNTLEIDPITGVAVAIGSGSVYVTYQVNNVELHSQSIYIHSAQKVGFHSKLLPSYITNNSTSKINYDSPVTIDNGGGGTIGVNCSKEGLLKNVVDTPAPFLCNLTFERDDIDLPISKLFDIKTVYHGQQKKFACRITPLHDSQISLKASVINSKLKLKVELNENAIDQHSKTTTTNTMYNEKVFINFRPAVHVHSSEVVLSTDSQIGNVYVTGLKPILNNLQIVPSDSEYLDVRSVVRDVSKQFFKEFEDVQKDAKNEAETFIYTVKLKSKFWSSGFNTDHKLFVSIKSVDTVQDIKIPVKIKIESNAAWKEDAEGIKGLIGYMAHMVYVAMSTAILGLVILVVITIGYRQITKTSRSSSQTTNTSVFVTNQSPDFHGSSPHRYYAPTPPTSNYSSGSPHSGAGDSFAGGETCNLSSSPSGFRLFSTQEGYGSPLRK